MCAKIIDCAQGTDSWWKARQGRITASNMHRIVTPKNWAYAAGSQSYIYELIAAKHAPSYEGLDEYSSLAMRNGVEREPEARRYYEFERGCEVQEVGFMLTDDDRFGYSPDGLVGDDGLIEIKSPNPNTQVKWLLAGGIPDEHLAQLHGGLIVSGRDWIDFLAYCHGLPTLLVRLEPNEKTEQLRVALERFWLELQEAQAKVAAMFAPTPTRVVELGHGLSYVESIYQESPY